MQQQTIRPHWHKHLIFPPVSELRWLCCGGSALWSHSDAQAEGAAATQGSSHSDDKGTKGHKPTRTSAVQAPPPIMCTDVPLT